jgi:hypothetical protein
LANARGGDLIGIGAPGAKEVTLLVQIGKIATGKHAGDWDGDVINGAWDLRITKDRITSDNPKVNTEGLHGSAILFVGDRNAQAHLRRAVFGSRDPSGHSDNYSAGMAMIDGWLQGKPLPTKPPEPLPKLSMVDVDGPAF